MNPQQQQQQPPYGNAYAPQQQGQQQPPQQQPPQQQPPQQQQQGQQQQQPYYGQPQVQQPYYGGQQQPQQQPQMQQQPQQQGQQPQQPQQQQQPMPPTNNMFPSTRQRQQQSNNNAPSTAVVPSRQRLMRPPFVDPVTNIIYDVDNPEYEGWLTKQSMWLKEWRRRYCILKGSKLFFGRNEYQGPHDMVDLASCTTVKSADLKSKKRHSFEISTPETCFLLYADTESEKDDWIGRVGKAIVRCSRTYYQQGDSGNGKGGNNTGGAGGQQRQEEEDSDDDDIYTNDDPDNPYFND